jgi:acetyl esterase
MPLHPEVAAYLHSQQGQPPRSTLSVEQTRAMMLRANALAGDVPGVARVDLLPAARQYWPEDNPDLPLVVYFHGGRFFSGGLESHDALCRAIAILSGCRLIAVDYRLAPEHPFPAAVDDAVDAVRRALQDAPAVAVAGDSAGANLAAGAALEVPGLRCQTLIYPMLDPRCSMPSHAEFAAGYGPGSEDMKRGWDLYLSGPSEREVPRVSPLFASDVRGAPPAFVLTAEYDTLRDEAEEYARRLTAAGVDVTLRRYSGAIHGFVGLTGVLSLARLALVEVGEYLAAHLREWR